MNSPKTHPATRKEALMSGMRVYFSGQSCPAGHIAQRLARNGECVECRRERNKQRCKSAQFRAKRAIYVNENKEKILASARQSYRRDAEKHKLKSRAYRQKNPEKIRAATTKYRTENANDLREKAKAYRAKPESKMRHALREKERRSVSVGENIRNRIQSSIRRSLRNAGARKQNKVEVLLGYSISDLRIHLEKQFIGKMNWDALLNGDIHIDHIVPVSEFQISSENCEEFKRCWALSNLRPMWSRDNLRKGAKSLFLL